MNTSVLFLCTGNSCRSQMAEGWLKHLGGHDYRVSSAGTNPTGVNTLAIGVMAEAGVDISEQTSDDIDRYLNEPLDLLITVCDRAKASCPTFPRNIETLNWRFEDPAQAQGSEKERLIVFRRVRDEIKAHIEDYLSGKGSKAS